MLVDQTFGNPNLRELGQAGKTKPPADRVV